MKSLFRSIYLGTFAGFAIIGLFLKLFFVMYIFLPIYFLLCPYTFSDDIAYVDKMNYLNHFDDWI